MPQLQVDFDVFKALTALRPSETVTENDVLRQLLNLPAGRSSGSRSMTKNTPATSPDDWVSKGVRFPVGTEFRASFKGQTHVGRVQAGALVVNGTRYETPSAAAMDITKTNTNGWMFWECRAPGEAGWALIKSLRPGP